MKRYYCTKCKRYHYRGKIYKRHKEFKEEKNEKNNNSRSKERNLIPNEKILKFDANKLRPIARRQIRRFLNKMNKTNRIKFYTREINRVIIHEQQNYMKK
ncbi:MAG: hypothetical protein EU539_05735 [Promethearchaeota archaeon]|nr:MAG: hypothetical protein EU539_05735 [Candidatus Lokiarchaeota archaeon]